MTTETNVDINQFVPSLVDDIKAIQAMRFIVHPAAMNWRQRNSTSVAQMEEMKTGLCQTKRPMIEIPRHDIVQRYQETLRQILDYFNLAIPNIVISLCSHVVTDSSITTHLPMMNYHPEDCSERSEEGLLRISNLLTLIAKWEISIFQTDRYWHSYGQGLMDEREWNHWLGLHANAVSLVSPRYIGQSLRDGYTPLRQVCRPDGSVKRILPHLVKRIPACQGSVSWKYMDFEFSNTSSSREILTYPWHIVGQSGEVDGIKSTSRVILTNKADGDKVLLAKRAANKSYPDMWHIPGGRGEQGEQLEETAVREIKEELDISLGNLTKFYSYFSSHNGGFCVTVFCAVVPDRDYSVVSDDENTDWKWFNKDQLPECAFQDRQILEMFFKKQVK